MSLFGFIVQIRFLRDWQKPTKPFTVVICEIMSLLGLKCFRLASMLHLFCIVLLTGDFALIFPTETAEMFPKSVVSV